MLNDKTKREMESHAYINDLKELKDSIFNELLKNNTDQKEIEKLTYVRDHIPVELFEMLLLMHTNYKIDIQELRNYNIKALSKIIDTQIATIGDLMKLDLKEKVNVDTKSNITHYATSDVPIQIPDGVVTSSNVNNNTNKHNNTTSASNSVNISTEHKTFKQVLIDLLSVDKSHKIIVLAAIGALILLLLDAIFPRAVFDTIQNVKTIISIMNDDKHINIKDNKPSPNYTKDITDNQ